jgi:hypothetical protein
MLSEVHTNIQGIIHKGKIWLHYMTSLSLDSQFAVVAAMPFHCQTSMTILCDDFSMVLFH